MIDTIVALSSAAGGSERAVVRLSGPHAFPIAKLPKRRGVRPAKVAGVAAAAWTMPAPHSYTGDDTVEFHLPGSPVLVRAVIDHLAARGARPAEPGEFTRRAFLNGRMDLPQAEAVARVIRAGSDDELNAAAALLRGEFSTRIRTVEDDLMTLCADVEASIDFVDEDIELLSPQQARGRVDALLKSARELETQSAAERTDGPIAFLVGPPNAGKSTLFNALTGSRAITSPEAGTTRDLLEAPVGRWTLVDAPGLDDAATGLDKAAIARAREAMEHADLWILVGDAQDPGRPHLKFDAKPKPEDVRRELDAISDRPGPAARFLLSRRQHALLRQARRGLERTAAALADRRGVEFVALEARAALRSLGAITGRHVDEAILDRIFERFCLGK